MDVNKNTYILVGTAVLSLAVGAAGGYIFAGKRLEVKFSDLATEEIAQAKKYYSKLYKTEGFSTPTTLAESYSDVVHTEGYAEEEEIVLEPDKEDPAEELRNVFVEAKDEPKPFVDLEYEDILKNRDTEVPYVLTQEEFLEAEPGYDQVTITYYEGDDVLADEKDQIINDVDNTIGVGNLSHFGLYVGDPNLVYIRNERLELDFEVLKSDGKYTEQVLGFIEHSDSRTKIRKFREDDW